MRILIVVPHGTTGILEPWGVARALASMHRHAGHAVQLLTARATGAPVTGSPVAAIPGARVATCDGLALTLLPPAGTPALRGEAAHAALVGWIRAQRFDVVHVLYPQGLEDVVAAVGSLGLPTVCTLDGVQPRPDMMALAKLLPVCVAPTAFAARCLAQVPGLAPAFEIGHGVDLLAHVAAAEGDAGRSPTLAAAHLMSPVASREGPDLLRAAWRHRPAMSAQLVLLGPDEADVGPALGDERVHWRPVADEAALRRALREVDLLLLPDPHPLPQAHLVDQAAAARLPVLVAQGGAAAEIVMASGAGHALPAHDVQAWAEALVAWATDPDLRASWQGRLVPPQRVEEEAFLYETIYRQAIAARRASGAGR